MGDHGRAVSGSFLCPSGAGFASVVSVPLARASTNCRRTASSPSPSSAWYAQSRWSCAFVVLPAHMQSIGPGARAWRLVERSRQGKGGFASQMVRRGRSILFFVLRMPSKPTFHYALLMNEAWFALLERGEHGLGELEATVDAETRRRQRGRRLRRRAFRGNARTPRFSGCVAHTYICEIGWRAGWPEKLGKRGSAGFLLTFCSLRRCSTRDRRLGRFFAGW